MTIDLTEYGSPDLTRRARKYLKRRGISERAWRHNNLRSLTSAQTAVLFGNDCAHEGLLVPYDEGYGTARIFGLAAEKGKFRTTAGEGARVYRPRRPKKVKPQNLSRLLLVEGPIKALACVANGFDAVGISGCWNWQKDRVAIPDLQDMYWKGERVVPIFDADVTDNGLVGLAYLALGDWLTEQKARVVHINIPEVSGRKSGVDDFIAKRGADKLRRHIRDAGEPWDESPRVAKLRADVTRNTEGGLAQRFLLDHADGVLSDTAEDTWYVYNGVVWERQPRSLPDVQQLMLETVDRISAEARRTKNPDTRKARLRWAQQCDNRRTMRGAIGLASSSPAIRTGFDEFDHQPDIVGTQNGVLNLRTGKLVASSRSQRVSRRLGVPFVARAVCPVWEGFLSQIMLKKADLVAFLQDLAGYILVSGNPHRYVFFLYGEGRNGKSVFMETLKTLMGEYSVAAQSALLMKSRGTGMERTAESAQPFLVQLRGARYITVDEVPEHAALDGAVVKRLASNDVISVRDLYAAPVEFVVAGKIVVRCNHRPTIDTDDTALWDRIIEVPFDYRVPKEDLKLMGKVRAELPGILNWALDGARRYYKRGSLLVPASVLRQTDDYRASMDSVAQFADNNLEHAARSKTRRSLVYGTYVQWCDDRSKRGIRVYSETKKEFNKRLLALGYKTLKTDGEFYWKDVRLA